MDPVDSGITLYQGIMIGFSVYTLFVLPVVGFCWKMRGWILEIIDMFKTMESKTESVTSEVKVLKEDLEKIEYKVSDLSDKMIVVETTIGVVH